MSLRTPVDGFAPGLLFDSFLLSSLAARAIAASTLGKRTLQIELLRSQWKSRTGNEHHPLGSPESWWTASSTLQQKVRFQLAGLAPESVRHQHGIAHEHQSHDDVRFSRSVSPINCCNWQHTFGCTFRMPNRLRAIRKRAGDHGQRLLRPKRPVVGKLKLQ